MTENRRYYYLKLKENFFNSETMMILESMRDWTFTNDNGKCPQMKHAHFYVQNWDTMVAENIGYLLWGSVGTGKSYFAGCIANALMEREIVVRMTNFALILNDLNAKFEDRNEYISQLCRALLLIIDDFGMERGTEYGLEQVYNVIDSRYRSKKPLIVTTNIPSRTCSTPRTPPTPVSMTACWKCALPSGSLVRTFGKLRRRTSWHD